MRNQRAVSYTHLDVYKRQVYAEACSGCYGSIEETGQRFHQDPYRPDL